MTITKRRKQTTIGLLIAIGIIALILLYRPLTTRIHTPTVYYVAPHGNDANPGTLQQPWHTIAKANQELQPGDTVYIREGTYNEVIRPTRSGTADEKITYANYSGESVILRGKAGEGAVVDLSNNHAVVVGFTIDRPHDGRKDKFGWVEIRGNHNTVRDCTIDKPGDPLAMYRAGYRERGILVFGTDSVIDGNYIRGHNQGIHFSRHTRRTAVTGNTVTGTGQSPIVLETSLSVLRGCLVEDNILERSAIEDGIQFMPDYDAPDRFADISNWGTIIRGNIIRYNAEDAIDLKSAAYIVIENNLIYGTISSNDGPLGGWNRNSSGAIMKGGANSTERVIIRHNILYDNGGGIRPYEDYRVYNNTCAGNNRDYTGPDSAYSPATKPYFYAIHRTSSGTIKIINNIMIGHNAVDISLRTSMIAYINNNLYFNSEVAQNFCNFIANDNWPTFNFANWKTHLLGAGSVSGNDAASVEANPNFTVAPERPESDDTNPAGEYVRSDFDLQAGSPAIDAGKVLTLASGGGTGTVITVDDALWFFDGYGAPGVDGDEINVGGDIVTITDINYATNQITVDQSITWLNNDPISLPYNGAAPDIGAYEFDGDSPPPPTPMPTSTSPLPTPTTVPPTVTPTVTPTSQPTATPSGGQWWKNCPPDPPTCTPWPIQPTLTPRPTYTPVPIPTCRPTATCLPNPPPTPYPTATHYPTFTPYPPQP